MQRKTPYIVLDERHPGKVPAKRKIFPELFFEKVWNMNYFNDKIYGYKNVNICYPSDAEQETQNT